jgi:hypothetical protein
MNAPAETPAYTLTVPPLLAVLIGELAERMAKAMGEPVDSCRRIVETSILSQGTAAVQAEVIAIENQAERNGWNAGAPTV